MSNLYRFWRDIRLHALRIKVIYINMKIKLTKYIHDHDSQILIFVIILATLAILFSAHYTFRISGISFIREEQASTSIAITESYAHQCDDTQCNDIQVIDSARKIPGFTGASLRYIRDNKYDICFAQLLNGHKSAGLATIQCEYLYNE